MELASIAQPGEYRVIRAEDMVGPLARTTLTKKFSRVTVTASGSESGIVYVVANGERIDGAEVDEMPFAIAFSGTEPTSSGVLLQHANYEGRTTTPDAEYWELLKNAGPETVFLMPGEKEQGPLADLEGSRKGVAFRIMVDEIKSSFEP